MYSNMKSLRTWLFLKKSTYWLSLLIKKVSRILNMSEKEKKNVFWILSLEINEILLRENKEILIFFVKLYPTVNHLTTHTIQDKSTISDCIPFFFKTLLFVARWSKVRSLFLIKNTLLSPTLKCPFLYLFQDPYSYMKRKLFHIESILYSSNKSWIIAQVLDIFKTRVNVLWFRF